MRVPGVKATWKATGSLVPISVQGGERQQKEKVVVGTKRVLIYQSSDAEDGNGAGFPWKDVALLVMVWLCFFALHVLIGDKHGKVRTARLSCLIHQLPTSSAYGMMIT